MNFGLNAETIRFVDLSFVRLSHSTLGSSRVHRCCQRYQVITDCLRQSLVSVNPTQLLLISMESCGLPKPVPRY